MSTRPGNRPAILIPAPERGRLGRSRLVMTTNHRFPTRPSGGDGSDRHVMDGIGSASSRTESRTSSWSVRRGPRRDEVWDEVPDEGPVTRDDNIKPRSNPGATTGEAVRAPMRRASRVRRTARCARAFGPLAPWEMALTLGKCGNRVAVLSSSLGSQHGEVGKLTLPTFLFPQSVGSAV
jgi:hypothetical protein